jgi:hypothetical protein
MGGAPLGLNVAQRVKLGVIVLPQPARVLVDDVLDLVHAFLHLDHLVDLFLIARDDEPRAAMLQHIGHLFGHGVLVERHGDGAHLLRRDHRPVECRPVASDDGDVVPPRSTPNARRPCAIDWISSAVSAHVQVCQMPYSFSR